MRVLAAERGTGGEVLPLNLGGAEKGKLLLGAIFIAHPYPVSVI